MEGTKKLTREDVDEKLRVYEGLNDAMRELEYTKRAIRENSVYPDIDDVMRTLSALKSGLFDAERAEELAQIRSDIDHIEDYEYKVKCDSFENEYGRYFQDFVLKALHNELVRLLYEYTKENE